MTKKNFILLASIASLLFLSAWLPNTAADDGPPLPRRAPLNPKFEAFMKTGGERSGEGGRLGYIPPPVSLSHVRGKVADPGARRSYAALYDLRTLDKLTSVKDQGDCGSCWTFGTYASLESFLKPGEANDFAEQDLNANHGFDYAECGGGNSFMSQAYLARWSGPLAESDSPYPYTVSALPRTLAFPQKHVQRVVYLPPRASYTDNNTIKYFVTEYGAVYFAFYWSATYFNYDTNAFYNHVNTGANHAVAIVGWNDNYAKSNFKTAPAGNGAFIVKNSWGSSWGDGGYFYISYYDKSLQEMTSFNHADSVDNYDDFYQYDPLGWVANSGYGSTVAWGANIFTASGNHYLSAVGFITNDVSTAYTIYVYKGVTAGQPRSGTLAATQSGTNAYPGYYTAALDTPVALGSGQPFSVVIQYKNSSYTYPLATEYKDAGYSSAATSNAGESFMSSSGSSWTDLYGWGYNDNCTIKAFCTDTAPTLTVVAPNGGESWPLGSSKGITWDSQGLGGNVKLVLYKNNVKVGQIANLPVTQEKYTWVAGSTSSGTATAGSDYRIKVVTINGAYMDKSDADFTLNLDPYVRVVAPNGGESWAKGALQPITWAYRGVTGNVRLVLYTGTTKIGIIADNLPATPSSYSWTVGNTCGGTAAAGIAYRIKIVTMDALYYDYSDKKFAITETP